MVWVKGREEKHRQQRQWGCHADVSRQRGIHFHHLSFTAKSALIREYIGAEGQNETFSDVLINPDVEFHFILSFAIDNTDSPTSPTSPTDNLTPSQINSIKAKHPNVKVATSLAGDTIGDGQHVLFKPTSIDSWVGNAISSITEIVRKYNLDGIDIDYEHFKSDPDTFAECMRRLLYYLKQNEVVAFTSIVPYEDNSGTTIPQFMRYFEKQSSNYRGGKILVSFGTDGSGGLSPRNGFFTACSLLRKHGKLHDIFIWSADDSKKDNFRYEKQSQDFCSRTLLTMSTNKEAIENLDARLGELQQGMSRLVLGFVNKLHHMEETLARLFETLLSNKEGSSNNTNDHNCHSRHNRAKFKNNVEGEHQVKPINGGSGYVKPTKMKVENWTQKALVGTFMGGLNAEIADDIRMFKPQSLKEAISLARMKDEQMNLQQKLV
ncbi:Glycoside hydrolase family 18, catalytic domain [Dillenia turbinata]|uniref:Glycoside hydrolase family 18, catalytic domain n=1 Tax=Dillenia turbinata TaxID=194707 RepID=A0AAN8VKU7_9MAGN